MLFRQIINDDLGCASYFIGCGGEAAIVDPQYDIAPYLALAEQHDVRITRVLETHTHADHVSGHGRLVTATGAVIHAPAAGDAEYDHVPLADGDGISFGNVIIRVIATPGHRPEHLSFAVIDTARDDAPWALLTGDSLLVGDVARPDLAVEATEGSAGLLESVQRLLEHPDHVEIWPGHVGGSLCGSSRLSGKTASTIGYERRANSLLAMTDASKFEAALTEGLKPKPPNYPYIVGLNRGPLHVAVPDVRALAPGDFHAAAVGGAKILDVRTAHVFDDAHIPGAISVPADAAGVGTRASWQISPGDNVILVADSAAQADATALMLASVGLSNIRGWLQGGIAAWKSAGYELRSARVMDVPEFVAAWQGGEVAVLDVRDPDEWVAGHIPGSTHIPLYELATHDRSADVQALGERIAVICASGARAGQAVALLEDAGVSGLIHVERGGVLLTPALGIELESGAVAAGAGSH